jgi:hypothetical protein
VLVRSPDPARLARLVLHELTPRLASLEEAFLERTAHSVQYQAAGQLTTGQLAGAGR